MEKTSLLLRTEQPKGLQNRLVRMKVGKTALLGLFSNGSVWETWRLSHKIVGMFSAADLSHLWGMLRLMHKMNFLTAFPSVAKMEMCLPLHFSLKSSKTTGTQCFCFKFKHSFVQWNFLVFLWQWEKKKSMYICFILNFFRVQQLIFLCLLWWFLCAAAIYKKTFCSHRAVNRGV